MTGAVVVVSLEAGAQDCFYIFMPMYHAAASVSSAATALRGGASIELRRRFSRREFWSDVRRFRATTCQYAGEICRYLLSEPSRPDDRDHPLRRMLGAGLGVESWHRWIERFGPMDIYEGWGSTEANTSTINLENRPGSCGGVPFWERSNRVARAADITTTFKLRKLDLQRHGIDPARCHDPLFVRDDTKGRYVPLTAKQVTRVLAT